MNNNIEIYKSSDGKIQLDVKLDIDTVWLSQKQLSELFQVTTPTINEHIKNIYFEEELQTDPTIRKFRIVQMEGSRKVNRSVDHYNLDLILSVGYRVKSKTATHFRQWTTNILKQHLIQGYTLNQQRIESLGADMGQLLDLMQRTLARHELAQPKGLQLTQLIGDYARSWTLLQGYDEQSLPEPESKTNDPQTLSEKEALNAIKELKVVLKNRGEASDLFGRPLGHGLDSSLGAIEQTFDGVPLYPTINSRAAHLLYFIIKNHPFTDGNKRIGSFLFLVYLERNKAAWMPNGSPKISDNAIVPLALLIAESDPKQKELVIRLIQHLLQGEEK
ncbi:MAG: virulence protein RhuM/Fic/DOC family protein [SAR324 cluster bacterium]|nr:virulence protein RhuM/Fic/DOC family protein [SAR324 cluster bacterium]